MIRQYYAQRCRGGYNPRRIGIIPCGAIFYVQDSGWWRDRFRGRPICREPWIVEGFLNGTVGAGRRNPDTGHCVGHRRFTGGRRSCRVEPLAPRERGVARTSQSRLASRAASQPPKTSSSVPSAGRLMLRNRGGRGLVRLPFIAGHFAAGMDGAGGGGKSAKAVRPAWAANSRAWPGDVGPRRRRGLRRSPPVAAWFVPQ
jgi:hypothetical protein